jgi:soluble lytic murein transglycosylase-like protein
MRLDDRARSRTWTPIRVGGLLLLIALLVPPPAGDLGREAASLEVPQKQRTGSFERPATVLHLAELPFRDEILAAATQTGLDPLLLASVIHVESRFRPDAVSHAGAVGLMQLLPLTARHYGVGDLADPGQNISAGSRLLAYMLDRYEGDLSLALAAYNAGESTVRRHVGVPPYPETRGYVRKVIARYEASAATLTSLAG